MSEHDPKALASGVPGQRLRFASGPPADAPATVLTRHASLDGRDVASLCCLMVEGGYAVECEVQPVREPGAAVRELGPYSFNRLDEAKRFVDEASLALEYLGCDVEADRNNPDHQRTSPPTETP